MRSPLKTLLSLFLFSCLIIICHSTVYFERLLAKPGHEHECYIAENDVYYQKGEFINLNKSYCGQVICKGSDGKGRTVIEHYTCGKTKLPPNCHIDVDLELPYPKCCGTLNCTQDEN